LLYFIFEGGIYPGEHIISNMENGGSLLKNHRGIADHIMNKFCLTFSGYFCTMFQIKHYMRCLRIWKLQWLKMGESSFPYLMPGQRMSVLIFNSLASGPENDSQHLYILHIISNPSFSV